jgi:hypothetical protein
MDLEDAVAVEPKIDPAAWAGGFNDIVRSGGREVRAGSVAAAGAVLPAGVVVADGAEERLVAG